MTERTDILHGLGLDPAKADATLRDGRDHGDALPWYVQVLIGIGAWISALFAIGLVVSVIALLIEPRDPEYLLLVLGAVGYGGALAAWRLARHSVFLDQLGAVVGVAGVASMAFAVALLAEDAWSVAGFLVVIGAVSIFARVGRLFQFLVAAMAIFVLHLALFEDKIPYGVEILLLLTLLPGVLMVRFPPRKWEVYPTAVAALFAAPVYDAFLWSWALSGSGRGDYGWSPATLAMAALFAVLLYDDHHRRGGGSVSAGFVFLGLAGILSVLALPPGGGTLVILLLLAYRIGSWPLTLSASVLEGFFLWRFYYDLQMTLLVKSGILTGVGLLLLGSWILLDRQARRSPKRVTPS